jgi:hypothetical protein
MSTVDALLMRSSCEVVTLHSVHALHAEHWWCRCYVVLNSSACAGDASDKAVLDVLHGGT